MANWAIASVRIESLQDGMDCLDEAIGELAKQIDQFQSIN